MMTEQAVIETGIRLNKSENACSTFNKNTYPIPLIEVEIDHARAQEGAAELLSHIRPAWSRENIKYTVSIDS